MPPVQLQIEYGPQGSASRHGLVTKLCCWDSITKADIVFKKLKLRTCTWMDDEQHANK